jgi:hypothetical protein
MFRKRSSKSNYKVYADYEQCIHFSAFVDIYRKETMDNGPRGPQLYNRKLYIYPLAS